MRKLLTFVILFAALMFAAPAGADTVHIEGMSRGNDFLFTFAVDWDSVTRDVTADVAQVDTLTGQPSNVMGIAPAGGRDGAGVVLTLSNGQQRSFNFFTLGLVNVGPTVVGNLNARSFTQRGGGSGLTYEQWYTPPAR